MSAALEAYFDFALYVDAKVRREEIPTTFAQWFEIENVLRGDQLTLSTEPAGSLTNPQRG